MQIYVDMDGVLADFDGGYEIVFGKRPNKEFDNADWEAIKRHVGFYENLPPMPDMALLWAFVVPYKPIVLTGVPWSVPEAPENKKAWIRKYLGEDVVVHCCASKEKCTFAKPGDILIDDWEKYRHLWEQAGGRWVTHTSAANSIAHLQSWGIG